MAFVLKCWSCGRTHIVEGANPTMGCDLALAAGAAGMKSVIDMRYGRVLVFCNETCIKAQTTKEGFIRRRPKTVA